MFKQVSVTGLLCGALRNAERARVQRHQPKRFCREEFRPQPSAKIILYANLSWRRELNPRPSDYKSDALPTELRQHRQTEQKYHRGNRIASKFLREARSLPDRQVSGSAKAPSALLLYSQSCSNCKPLHQTYQAKLFGRRFGGWLGKLAIRQLQVMVNFSKCNGEARFCAGLMHAER